ncbi:hypothetical protein CFK37_04440 [Virgibacillus phasianinus]|uniref:Uncharacterized protein n=1 Tax=Virgibacillus phasianinus TaxID=2017483 RepID=A0A220TZL1_9BACI|nr:hypothetical protein [Virgibacillus phasianinus]ASK61474.1 hypothetical protein CFK37_04440 [Virgibacillus phasianinus]
MRKYWKAALVIAVIVFGVGAYYVNAAISAPQKPEFVIKKQSGDEKEVQSIVLDGSYQVGFHGEPLQLTSTGTRYDSEVSFFDRLNGFQKNKITELEKEYRSFMRGKNGDINAYFEDNQYLVYADVEYKRNDLKPSDFRFKIAVLDKQDDKATSLNLSVPNESNLDWVMIEDVQKKNDQIVVMTQNHVRDSGNRKVEVREYRFDISNKKLVENKKIMSQEESENTQTDIYMMNESSPLEKHENVVFAKVVTEFKPANQDQVAEGPEVEEILSDYISYNYDRKEKNHIKLPESIKKAVETDGIDSNMFNGTKVYFMRFNEKGITITPYSLNNRRIEDEISLSMQINNKYGGMPPITTIRDGKVYAASPISDQNTKSNIVVADLKSGKTVFKGEIISKEPTQTNREYELYFHQLYVK